MANEEMWDKLLKRVASFKAELKPTKTTATDAYILAFYAIRFGFALAIADRTRAHRRLKDRTVTELRQYGLSSKRIQEISDMLSGLCDLLEETK